MTDTSSHIPVCVHCGTSRPADETFCPTCGKPWIDVTIEASTPAAVVASASATESQLPKSVAVAAAIDDTGEFSFDDWTLPPEPKSSKAKWIIPAVLLVAVAALWSLVFLNSGSSGPAPVALDTTTTQVTTPTTTATTTVAVAAAEPSTTTSTTTPPPAFPAASTWTAQGEPVANADLALKASGIGPIALGSNIVDTAGTLVASLGPASDAGLESDTCTGTERYWLGWGDLTVFFSGPEVDAEFVAYRNEDAGRPKSGPAFKTLSGLSLGDSVETLNDTYSFYTVSFEVIEGQSVFRLLDSSELLLWGPITNTDPTGTVEGIYSPDECPASDS